MSDGSGHTGITVTDASGAAVPFASYVDGDKDVHVVPFAAQSLVGQTLDPALFDVTLLAREGLAGPTPKPLRLIAANTAVTAALPGTTAIHELASIDSTALLVSPAGAADLARALMTHAADGTAAVAGLGGEPLKLDRTLHASLDETAPQIGAPVAWDRGIHGAGVRIAILDTGIDSGHPDVGPRIVAAQSFVGDGSPQDVAGHGTYVASIAAGSGAASGGRFTGIADDADLVNAKVLDDSGSGYESDIIAGLEWAAGPPKADIINMSFNGEITDGTDPLSEAVDAVSEQSDVLVVASAGNSGGYAQSVETPASATDALAVGLVDKSDALADFSPWGPRALGAGVKPEIVAPGVDVTAARASGADIGEPVDDGYTALTGTSAAAPHVAGAAALLLEEHRDWTWSQLKAALVTTATQLSDLTAYQQGGGRVDIPSALDATVRADEATLDLGVLAYPHDGETSTRDVTLTNAGAAVVDLDLAVAATGADGSAAPPQMLSVEPAAVAIPAGGSTVVRVTFDERFGPEELFSGNLTASAGGTELIHVPLGFEKEPESYNLTIDNLSRAGDQNVYGYVWILNVEDGSYHNVVGVSSDAPTFTVRVPKGVYGVGFGGNEELPDGELDLIAVSKPEFDVSTDTDVVLDARTAQQVNVDVGTPTTSLDAGQQTTRIDEKGQFGVAVFELEGGLANVRQFATPTEKTTLGRFQLDSSWTLMDDKRNYDLLFIQRGGIPAHLAYDVGPEDLARVDTVLNADVDGRAYDVTRMGFGNDGFLTAGAPYSVAVPGQREDWVSAGRDVGWLVVVDEGEGFDGVFAQRDFSYRPDTESTERWYAQPVRPGSPPEWPGAYRSGDTLTGGIFSFLDQDGNAGFADQPYDRPSIDDVHYTLSASGTTIATGTEFAFSEIDLPHDAATYTLEIDATRTADWWLMSTHTHSVFTFPSGPTNEYAGVATLQINYGVAVDELNRGTAPTTVSFDAYGSSDPLQSLAAEWSTDDGATWHPVDAAETSPTSYEGEIAPPDCAPSCAVSLHVVAADIAGRTVDQTIIRAYTAVGGATATPTTTPTSSVTAISSPTPTGHLPGTGAGDSRRIAGVALLVLAIGAGLVVVSRRRLED